MVEELAPVLRRLEAALAAADPAGLDGSLAGLVADDFLEFGASGRAWTADEVREALAGSTADGPVDLEAFEVSMPAPDVALVTCRLGPPRPSNRSSVRVGRDRRWQVRFHQGTLRPEA
ncbi:MAG: nuclear transport factor 2 family protein [Chloroflexota bacterium]